MGSFRKLYEQAVLIYKPTEATSSVLDLILSLFTARVITFESLSHSSHLSHAADHQPNLTLLRLNRSCAITPSSSNKRSRALRPPFFSSKMGSTDSISNSCSSTEGRASSYKMVLLVFLKEEANGLIPKALRASFVIFQAN